MKLRARWWDADRRTVRFPASTRGLTATGRYRNPVTLRIMLVGDSMTVGSRGDRTWRYRLWRHLRATGADCAFTGPCTGVYDRETGTVGDGYRDPDFATAHHAAWGRPIGRLNERITADVERYRPDVLLVLMGLIDLGFYTPADATETNLRAFVTAVRAGNPAARIVLAPVPFNDRALADPLFAAQRVDLNARQERVVADLSTPGSPLRLTGDLPQWDLLADTYDGTHPSERGEHKIAATFADTLWTAFGVGGAYGPIPRTRSALPAPGTPTAIRTDGTGLVLRWPPVPGADRYHVLVRDVTGGPWARLPWPVTGTRCPFADLLPGHTYAFAVRALRGTGEGPSSPVLRAVVTGATRGMPEWTPDVGLGERRSDGRQPAGGPAKR